MTRSVIDYSTVTEVPGNQVTAEALDMLWTRYAFAATYCEEKAVLEVACGAGQGLAYLATKSRRVVAGDYTEALVQVAHGGGASRIPLVRFDGQWLPFQDGAFDAIVLFEAIYYLESLERFLAECQRVLRPGGVVVISSVNSRWSDFNPSPFSTRYLVADELRALMAAHGFTPNVFGGFPMAPVSGRTTLVSWLKRTAVALGLIPRTMAGKTLLKRLFLGRLHEFPSTIREGRARYRAPVVLPAGAPDARFKVIYAVGRVPVS